MPSSAAVRVCFWRKRRNGLEQRGEDDPEAEGKSDEPDRVERAEHQTLDRHRQRRRDAEQPPQRLGGRR